MLREIIPGLRRMAILANFSSPAGVVEIGLVERAARSVGIEVEAPEIRRGEDIARAIEALKGRAEAIYIQSDPLFNFNKVLTNTLALNARLPTVVGLREFLADGGLDLIWTKHPRSFSARRGLCG